MSAKNNNKINKRTSNNPRSRKQFFYRACAMILALLMLGGMLVSALIMLTLPSKASPTSENPLISVGLVYGESVTAGFESLTINGYTVGAAITLGSKSFTPLWTVSQAKVRAVIDANLSKASAAAAYQKTSSTANTVIGAYNIQLDKTESSRSAAEALVANVNTILSGTSYYAIPSYINGKYRVRVGNFPTAAAAETAKNSLSSLKAAYALSVASPTDTGVSLVDPANDKVLFKYDCNNSSNMGLEPISASGTKAYTVTPAKRTYDGVFVYRRYISSTSDGVSLINLIHLEDYIAGVIPWEISPSWHFEAQRVFAIAARTYAMQSLGRHSSYSFDICNSTHCQAYLGCGTANENVYNAIADTEGLVLSFNNKLAQIFYSSSSGGETVSATHAWGGGVGLTYLATQPTPWEKYSIRGNGVWQREVSGEELLVYFRDVQNMKELKGNSISSIKINSCAGDTSYVYSMTITDSAKNTKVVNCTDAVRTALARYVHSANFVVGIGSVTRSYDVVSDVVVSSTNTEIPEPVYPDIFEKFQISAFNHIDKLKNSLSSKALQIPTKTQSESQESADVPIAKAAPLRLYGAPEGGKTTISASYLNGGGVDIIVDKHTVTETITATKNGNFVFAGKGYGHGVGISQWGSLDLAEAGGRAEVILSAYFPGIEILPYSLVK